MVTQVLSKSYSPDSLRTTYTTRLGTSQAGIWTDTASSGAGGGHIIPAHFTTFSVFNILYVFLGANTVFEIQL